MNRNNCGCAPYKATTNRTDYENELYGTCDCVLPCDSCECVEQTGTCPPPPPCKPLKLVQCCVEKPKKGFWQLLFGSKKCSPCLVKKQRRKRKPATKLKCVPLSNLNNERCEDDVKCQQATVKLNSNLCPRKECFPTPKTICGCHFYFNIENRSRKPALTIDKRDEQNFDQEVCENNQTQDEYGYDIHEEPERDNLAAPITSPKVDRRKIPDQNTLTLPHEWKNEGNQRYPTNNRRSSGNERRNSSVSFHPYNGQTRRSNGMGYNEYLTPNKKQIGNEKRKIFSVASRTCDVQPRRTGTSCNGQRKISHCIRKRESCVNTEDKSNDVHIGVTFTKEETTYFMPNSTTCLPLNPEQKSNSECKNSQSHDSKETSQQLLTVEIHKSGIKVSHEDSEEDGNDITDLDHKKTPKSESLSRELLPMMNRRKTVDGLRSNSFSTTEDGFEETTDNTPRERYKNKQSFVSQGCSKSNLDRRVSEILKKLNEIENKINIIEKKEHDNKEIRVDFDGAKSSVSLHIKDPITNKYDNGYNCTNSSKKGAGNTVIEIRHAESKSHSAVRRSLRSSQLSDACDKNQSSSHKIVIKLPKTGTKTQCFVLPEKQNKVIENCQQVVPSCKVSDELKCYPLTVSTKCYCYECVQKRLRCF